MDYLLFGYRRNQTLNNESLKISAEEVKHSDRLQWVRVLAPLSLALSCHTGRVNFSRAVPSHANRGNRAVSGISGSRAQWEWAEAVASAGLLRRTRGPGLPSPSLCGSPHTSCWLPAAHATAPGRPARPFLHTCSWILSSAHVKSYPFLIRELNCKSSFMQTTHICVHICFFFFFFLQKRIYIIQTVL